MPLYFLIGLVALAGVSGNSADFQNDRVSLHVEVASSVYTYTVTNLSAEPVVRFEIAQHATYDLTAPRGWQTDGSSGRFRAWPVSAIDAIGPNQEGRFSMRVSSRGAVLGAVPATVRFGSGETIEFAGVWAPIREPRSYLVLVVSVFAAVVVLHSALVIRKNSRGEGGPV